MAQRTADSGPPDPLKRGHDLRKLRPTRHKLTLNIAALLPDARQRRLLGGNALLNHRNAAGHLDDAGAKPSFVIAQGAKLSLKRAHPLLCRAQRAPHTIKPLLQLQPARIHRLRQRRRDDSERGGDC